MKKQNEKDKEETFLSEWIDGRISDEQLKERVGETDFMAYLQLRQVFKGLDVANPELTEHYARVREKIEQRGSAKKRIMTKLYRYAAVAAILLLCSGLFQLFVFSEKFSTGNGKIQHLVLKDDSEVTMNANSTVKCPAWFQFNRKLSLEGEAFFEVKKGSRFTVSTSQGTIEVLGTKFNVNAREDFFEVICFEGKVKVTTPQQTITITKGMAVRCYNHEQENWILSVDKKPSWIDGTSSFRQLPLKRVIKMVMQQYDCQITFPEALADTKITGSFDNKHLDIALQSICVPLQLKYKKVGANHILIFE